MATGNIYDTKVQIVLLFVSPGDLQSFRYRVQDWVKMGNMSVTPGAMQTLGVRFDYGKYNEMLNALEVGIGAEISTKKFADCIC